MFLGHMPRSPAKGAVTHAKGAVPHSSSRIFGTSHMHARSMSTNYHILHCDQNTLEDKYFTFNHKCDLFAVANLICIC